MVCFMIDIVTTHNILSQFTFELYQFHNILRSFVDHQENVC